MKEGDLEQRMHEVEREIMALELLLEKVYRSVWCAVLGVGLVAVVALFIASMAFNA